MDEEITRIQPSSPPSLPVEEESTAGPTNAPLAVGTVLGNFRLERVIGAGLLSEIYQAQNLVAGKPCAVKIFKREVPLGPVALGRYVHELEQVSRIDHPSIADIYSSGNIDGHTYTAMELVEGTDLRAVVRQKAPLSKRTLLPLMRGLCLVLAEVHAFGLSHRHLHGGQVMVNWSGPTVEVKLLDFGTHHLVPSFKGPPAGWTWGGPEHAIYVSPEQAKGENGDARSDIYALAVMLYEMATGKVPFLGESFAATLEQHISEQAIAPRQLNNMPAELEETILRGLEKDPRKRIPSVEALLAGLDPMAVTGQHSRHKVTTTGSYRALTNPAAPQPDHAAPEHAAPEHAASPQASGQPAPHQPRSAPRLEVPRSRLWLYIVLGVVVVACSAAIAILLLSEDDPPTRKRARPRAAVPRRPPPPAPSPRATAAPAVKVARAVEVESRTDRIEERPPREAPRAAELTRASADVGTLVIHTPSALSHIFINGKFQGRGRRLTSKRAPGTYRVHLVVRGEKHPAKDVELGKDQRVDVKF